MLDSVMRITLSSLNVLLYGNPALSLEINKEVITNSYLLLNDSNNLLTGMVCGLGFKQLQMQLHVFTLKNKCCLNQVIPSQD